MKNLLFPIILVIIILTLSSQDAKAMPYMSPQDLYKQSDSVVYGQVIAKGHGPGPDYYNYQIKVLTYFKNPQTSDSLTIAGHVTSKFHVTYPQFEVGDKAIFYTSKIDGINTMSSYSVAAGNACNVQSFSGAEQNHGSQTVQRPHSDQIYLGDADGSVSGPLLTNHMVTFHDDEVWNDYPGPRLVPVTLSIKDEYGGQQVFNQTQSVEMQACSGPGKVKWNFVPTQIENYVATVTDHKGYVSMGFYTVSDITNSVFASPLEQARSGTMPNNVHCKDGLGLLIKAEDGTPACVGPETAQKLVDRGWAKHGTYYLGIHVQPEITLDDYNYAGIDNDSNTTVTVNGQTYYQTTLDYSAYKLPAATPIQFHNVAFTFPAGIFLTPGGAIIMLDIKFPDGYQETYGSHTANGGSGIFVPTPYGPHLAANSTTILSNHMRPQAGMTIYHDKIRLLVSTDTNSSSVSTQISSSSEALTLNLSTSSQVIQSGQPIGITISVNNTLSKPITLGDENSWKLNDLGVNPCTSAPYGIAVFDGFYSEENVTHGKPLAVFNTYNVGCYPYIETSQNYTFRSSSDHVILGNCKDAASPCPSSGLPLGEQFSFGGVWKYDHLKPFNPGLYTVVGGDEWGHLAVQHFVVTNSTIFAGDLGPISCPAIRGGIQFGADVKNSTGFSNYWNSTLIWQQRICFTSWNAGYHSCTIQLTCQCRMVPR